MLRHSVDDVSSVRASYESHIEPRSIVVSRKAMRPQRSQSHSFQSISALKMKPKNESLGHMESEMVSEKRDMARLNDNFARYLERVRFLQALNKKLSMDLAVLNGIQCDEAKFIRSTYETEIARAKDVSKDTLDSVLSLRTKTSTLEDKKVVCKSDYDRVKSTRVDQKRRIRDLNEAIMENNEAIRLLRRKLADIKDEMDELHDECEFLKDEISYNRELKSDEELQTLKLRSEVDVIKEEIEALKRQHDKELRDLREKALPKDNLEFSHYFRDELAKGIDKIRQEFNAKGDAQASKLQELYQAKVSEIVTAYSVQNNANATLNESKKQQSATLREAVTSIESENMAIKSKNAELSMRIKNIENEIDREKRHGTNALFERDIEVERLKKEKLILAEALEEAKRGFQSLNDEIRTYEKLLEGETSKIGLKQIVMVSEALRDKLINPISLTSIASDYGAQPVVNVIVHQKDKYASTLTSMDNNSSLEARSESPTNAAQIYTAKFVTPNYSTDTGYPESASYSYSFTTSSFDEHKIVRRSQGGSTYL